MVFLEKIKELEKIVKEDERYLYIPALKKIERIVASGKAGKFFSSDFTYYDVGKPKLADWKYKLIGETDKYFVIEALPFDESALFIGAVLFGGERGPFKEMAERDTMFLEFKYWF